MPKEKSMNLEGGHVVVIGGSSGIGLATAQLARDAGAEVTIAGRAQEKLLKAQQELGQVHTVVMDITDEGAVEKAFADLHRVDHVLISAGTIVSGAIVQNDLATLRRIVDERLWGLTYVVRHAAPRMSQGSITFTSGSLSSRPRPGTAMLTAMLSAVEALAPALALELAPVRVNAVTPGLIDTPLLHSAYGAERDTIITNRAAILPGKRVGTADQVAQVVLMLMTNVYMTGEVVHVDGGGRFV
jgi:NAD(P)-dependent dehydrogenase (short-subunit alcohol dehydrogenase family)